MTARDTTPPRRRDFSIPGDPGVELFVREVRAGAAPRGCVVLLHGARVPGLASFDLDVPGGSLAADLARAGYAAYVMDARGYGGSTRPPEMAQAPQAHPPLVRSAEVVRDVAAVVAWVARHAGVARVALLGWATGGLWLGHYATLCPGLISHLVAYNTLYGNVAEHPSLGRGSGLEDPQRPGHFAAAGTGAYRFNTAASLLPAWDTSIPIADKARWRDPAVAAAYQAAALASDPTSAERTPPSFRAPSGALEDSFYAAIGRQLWDASLLRVPTLVLRSEYDFWSRPEDARRLVEHAVHAPVARAVEIAGATHFVHLDRPERGRDTFLRTILDFLGA